MKVYDLVLKIMKDYPQTRSSDRLLLWKFWEKEGCVIGGNMTYALFNETTPAESITRARRMVQEHHPELQAVEAVKQSRKAKEEKSPLFVFDPIRQVFIRK